MENSYCRIGRVNRGAVHKTAQLSVAVAALSLFILSVCGTAFSATDHPATNGSSTGQPRDAQDVQKAAAQSHFARGEELFKAGEFAEAAAAFTLAYNTLPHFAVLANIGLSYERSGDYPRAVEYLRKYTKALGERGETNAAIDALLADTVARVGELAVTVEGYSEDCKIYVDGLKAGASPAHVIVVPGEHRVQLMHGGTVVAENQLSVVAGEIRHFTIAESGPEIVIPKTSPVLTDDITTVPRQSEKWRAPFRVSVGLTIGTGIVAGGLWAMTLGTKYKFDNIENYDEKKAVGRRGERLQVAAGVVTGVAGAAALMVGIIGALRKSSREKNRDTAVSVKAFSDTVGVGVLF